MVYLGLILGAVGVILIPILCKQLIKLLWRPYVITRHFRKQGVLGPKYRFLTGSVLEMKSLADAAKEIELDIHSHDILPRSLPHFYTWMNQYGGVYLYWLGPHPALCITDAEHVKQVLANKFGFYAKPTAPEPLHILLGKGLVLTDGEEWARHRRVVSPAFTMDKLKVMTKQMAECTLSVLDSWHQQIIQTDKQQKSIEVNKQFQELTADVISHAAFSSSYNEGKEVFLAQKELLSFIFSAKGISFPGSRYLPTKFNRTIRALDRKMKNTVVSIINKRLDSKESSGYGNDLLGLMIESSLQQEGSGLSTDEIVDECKTFFFAGHETTSNLLTWTIFLLSTNLEWQEKLREEVIGECGTEIPGADNLSKLKMVGMVLLEALRLYGPVAMIARVASQDMKLGNVAIPKHTAVFIPFAVIHRNKELWGDDADKFNPLRFENGVTKAAKHPSALLAFSIGPRACIGQNFAMLEAKTVVAMILQRFSFSLSPEYKHKPTDMFTLQPLEGMPIVLKPLVS